MSESPIEMRLTETMKTYFITYRKRGQQTKHTRPIEAMSLKQAIDLLVSDRASHGESVTVMWVN
jgi:hypothetical protein